MTGAVDEIAGSRRAALSPQALEPLQLGQRAGDHDDPALARRHSWLALLDRPSGIPARGTTVGPSSQAPRRRALRSIRKRGPQHDRESRTLPEPQNLFVHGTGGRCNHRSELSTGKLSLLLQSSVRIHFLDQNDTDVDVTGKTASSPVPVFIGQHIELSVEPAVPTTQNPQWIIPGVHATTPGLPTIASANGGFTWSATCPSPINFRDYSPPSPLPACSGNIVAFPSTTTEASIAFYWLNETTFQVQYQYKLGDGVTPGTAQTVFQAAGPDLSAGPNSTTVLPKTAMGVTYPNVNSGLVCGQVDSSPASIRVC